jgi:hypothetical protein
VGCPVLVIEVVEIIDGVLVEKLKEGHSSIVAQGCNRQVHPCSLPCHARLQQGSMPESHGDEGYRGGRHRAGDTG